MSEIVQRTDSIVRAAVRRDDWLIRQLPVGMLDDDFFVRFVAIFQTMADTVLEQVDNLPHVFDVSVAPDEMVRAIGAWVGLDWVDPTMSDARQRALVRGYCGGLPWRGTARGLRRLLELVTEGPVEVDDTGGVHLQGDAPMTAPHVRVRVATTGHATDDDLLRIVRDELPASVTFELAVGDSVVHSPDARPPAGVR